MVIIMYAKLRNYKSGSELVSNPGMQNYLSLRTTTERAEISISCKGSASEVNIKA